MFPDPASPFAWNGNYYVTLRLSTGAIVRRNAKERLPKGGCLVLAVDNGMLGSRHYREQLSELRREARN